MGDETLVWVVNASMSWEQTGLSCRTEPEVRFGLPCLGLGGWAVIYADNTLKYHHCTVLASRGTHLSELARDW